MHELLIHNGISLSDQVLQASLQHHSFRLVKLWPLARHQKKHSLASLTAKVRSELISRPVVVAITRSGWDICVVGSGGAGTKGQEFVGEYEVAGHCVMCVVG